MNPYGILVVNTQLESLRAEAALRRQLPAQPSVVSRVASVIRTTWAAVTTPAPIAPTITPTLNDYPYRS